MGAGVRVTTCTNIRFVVSSQAALWGSVAQHRHIHVRLSFVPVRSVASLYMQE